MLYGLRWLTFNARRLIWLPFYVLGHRSTIGLGLIASGYAAWDGGLHPVEMFGYVLMVLFVCGIAMKMSELLHPGRAPAARPKKAKPLPPAIAQPAGTSMGGSPDEREVLTRLPPALQQFLAQERAAASSTQRQAAE